MSRWTIFVDEGKLLQFFKDFIKETHVSYNKQNYSDKCQTSFAWSWLSFFVKQELFFVSCWEILSLSRFFCSWKKLHFLKIRPMIFLYENNNVMWPFLFIDLKIYIWVSSLQFVHSLGKERKWSYKSNSCFIFLIIWIFWFKHFRNIRILLELTYVIWNLYEWVS